MLKMFTILFKAHIHSLFNCKNLLYSFRQYRLFNFMLQQELLTAEEILSKMFLNSAQVISNHQQLPEILTVFQEIFLC